MTRIVAIALAMTFTTISMLACTSAPTTQLPTSTARSTPTPLPTLEPTLVPTPNPKPSYRPIPDTFPFTINVPSHWNVRLEFPEHGTEHRFFDPDGGDASIVINTAISETLIEVDAEELADFSSTDLENTVVPGTLEEHSRNVLADGSIKLTVSYKQRRLCHVDAVWLIRVERLYAFIVEASACSDEWADSESVLLEAIDSFAPKPFATR